MEKIYKQAIDLVENLFESCDPQLNALIYMGSDFVRISAPLVFIDLLIEAHEQMLGTSLKKKGKLKYRNVEIIPNYEMEVVLFHMEYPRTLEPLMIHKIKLNSGKNVRPVEYSKIDISKDENGNLTATSFFSIPDRSDILPPDPTKPY